MPTPVSYPAWLERVPNHEMKSAVMFGLLSAGGPLGETALHAEIIRLQDGLIDFPVRAPRQFCERSLQPADFTEQTTVTSMALGKIPVIARGDQLTDHGLERGVALCGDVASWSLLNQELTLSEVLGKTNSSQTDDGIPHVNLRFTILKNLLSADDGLAISDLAGTYSPQAASSAVREMESAGVLTAARSHQSNSRTFEIVNPDHITGERRKTCTGKTVSVSSTSRSKKGSRYLGT